MCLISLCLVAIPALSLGAIVVLFEVYADFLAYPLRLPPCPLIVVFAFWMQDVVGWTVGQAISAVFCAIFASCGVLIILLTFVSSSIFADVGPAWRVPFSHNWGWRWSQRLREGGAATVHSFFFFLFTPSPSGCCSFAVCGYGGFSLSSGISNWYCGAVWWCTNCWSLVIPWLTMSANSPCVFAFLRSCAASAVARIRRTLQMESTLWLWLYMYLDTILWWATLISVPQVCCDAHSVLERIMTARRLLCTHTTYPYDFAAIAAMRSTLITTVSFQSKNFPAMLTNFRLMFVASQGHFFEWKETVVIKV